MSAETFALREKQLERLQLNRDGSCCQIAIIPSVTAVTFHERNEMIRLIAFAAFAFTTSAMAMTPAPLRGPDRMITQAREACGAGRVRINGLCVARTTTRQVRRAARRCAGWSEGFCTQPLRRYRCHGEVMSYIDVLYLGLLLVAFLGFAAALFYFWRRFSNRNPPTRLESKRFRRGENS